MTTWLSIFGGGLREAYLERQVTFHDRGAGGT